MRLIDADALEKAMTRKACIAKLSAIPTWSKAISEIHDAPTVVPETLEDIIEVFKDRDKSIESAVSEVFDILFDAGYLTEES